MVEIFKKQVKQYIESGNVLDDSDRLESLVYRIKARIAKSSDINEIEHLSQLLKDLAEYKNTLN
jgi:hypothetical protein